MILGVYCFEYVRGMIFGGVRGMILGINVFWICEADDFRSILFWMCEEMILGENVFWICEGYMLRRIKKFFCLVSLRVLFVFFRRDF